MQLWKTDIGSNSTTKVNCWNIAKGLLLHEAVTFPYSSLCFNSCRKDSYVG